VFKDFHSDVAVELRKLGNMTRKTAENNDTIYQTTSVSNGSEPSLGVQVRVGTKLEPD